MPLVAFVKRRLATCHTFDWKQEGLDPRTDRGLLETAREELMGIPSQCATAGRAMLSSASASFSPKGPVHHVFYQAPVSLL